MVYNNMVAAGNVEKGRMLSYKKVNYFVLETG